jgi:hypothetical protein
MMEQVEEYNQKWKQWNELAALIVTQQKEMHTS